MAKRSQNVYDVLTEYYDGSLIYKFTVNGKTKLAKFAGMRLWLQEIVALEVITRLKKLHWLLEKSHIEESAITLRRDKPVSTICTIFLKTEYA